MKAHFTTPSVVHNIRGLSHLERQILGSLDLHSQKPFSKVARETGFTVKDVVHTVKELENRNIVRSVPLINLFRLGFNDYVIWFSFGSNRKHEENKLLELLISSRYCVWLARFSGQFQYGVSMRAASIGSFSNELDSIFLGRKTVLSQKAFSVRNSFTLYGRKFLSGGHIERTPYQLSVGGDTYAPSPEEQRVLTCIARDANVSPETIAASTNLSLESTKMSLKRLEKSGVLAGSFYELNLEMLGIVHHKVLLRETGHDLQFRKRLLTWCEQHPNVFYSLSCFGYWDYEIGIEALAHEDVVSCIADLCNQFGDNIAKVVSVEVEDYLKRENHSF